MMICPSISLWNFAQVLLFFFIIAKAISDDSLNFFCFLCICLYFTYSVLLSILYLMYQFLIVWKAALFQVKLESCFLHSDNFASLLEANEPMWSGLAWVSVNLQLDWSQNWYTVFG